MSEWTERRYTLDEAAWELRRRQCDQTGHTWTFIQTCDGEPRRIVCYGCGWSGNVKMGGRPTRIALDEPAPPEKDRSWVPWGEWPGDR